ncbi:hypothetical protein D3C77_433090 [compost metagenome]
MIMKGQFAARHCLLGRQGRLRLFEVLADQGPDLPDTVIQFRIADEVVELLDGNHVFSDCFERIKARVL